MLLLLSSDTNLTLFERWAKQVGFDWQLLAKKSIGVEAFLIFRLGKGPAKTFPNRADCKRPIYDSERKNR